MFCITQPVLHILGLYCRCASACTAHSGPALRVCLNLYCTLWACTTGVPQPVLHTLSMYCRYIMQGGTRSLYIIIKVHFCIYSRPEFFFFIEKLDLSISFSSRTLSLHQQKRISMSFPQLNSSLFTKKRISSLLLYLTSFVDN